jgi:hypothetical protein
MNMMGMKVKPEFWEKLKQPKIKWVYALEGELDPRSQVPTLWRMLGEPTEITRLRVEHAAMVEALLAAEAEIQWWVKEHGCCLGHEEETLAKIRSALLPKEDQ